MAAPPALSGWWPAENGPDEFAPVRPRNRNVEVRLERWPPNSRQQPVQSPFPFSEQNGLT